MSEEQRPTLATGVVYRDPKAALAWLEEAFGFEPSMVVVAADGTLGHSEMRLGDGLIMVGREWDERHRSPASVGQVNTQSIHVHLDGGVAPEGGIDAHCERARAAGAVILREPSDQFYGDRVYVCADPEGHVWSFSVTLTPMSYEEMSRVGGVSVRKRL
jgi:uncharacterized glyoxalase superfamily protein PhnB